MELTFLGTGTSHGIPVIGCHCRVCTSPNPKTRRTRSSILVEVQGPNILIDTATEFRLQALAHDIHKVDAVLYTHCHADHVFGFDDLRMFGHQQQAVPVYGNEPTILELRSVFSRYAFRKTQEGGGKPQWKPIWWRVLLRSKGWRLSLSPFSTTNCPFLGYRIGQMAYITDCSCIPAESLALLQDLKVLILGVVLRTPSYPYAPGAGPQLVERLRPMRTYFTHFSPFVEHHEKQTALPQEWTAFDGFALP